MSAPGKYRARKAEIKQKQRRRKKLRKLKTAYRTAENDHNRKRILAKLKKIAPNYPLEVFQAAS